MQKQYEVYRALALVLGAATLLLTTAGLPAAVHFNNNDGNGLFSDDDNWTSPPGTTQGCIIGSSVLTPATATIVTGEDLSVLSLYLGYNAYDTTTNYTGTLVVEDGASITTSSLAYIGYATHANRPTSGTLQIGTTTPNGGQVANPASINVGANLHLGIVNASTSATAQTTATVDWRNGSLSAGGVYIGRNGSASLALPEYGTLTADTLVVGYYGDGTLTMNHASQTLDVSGTMSLADLGNSSSGTFNWTAGSVSVGANFIVGRTGTASFTMPGETLNVGASLYAGFINSYSDGEIYVTDSNATVNVTNHLYLGHGYSAAGSYGRLDYTAGTMTFGGNGYLGYRGTGELTIGSAVSLALGDVLMGYGGGTGTIDVAGSFSADKIQMGNASGTASVNQTAGTTTVSGTIEMQSANATYTLSGGTLDAATIDLDTYGNVGAFSFTGGTLAVDNFLGSLSNTGGTLSPGNSPGTTNISGDYSQDATSSLLIELGGTGVAGTVYDLVAITGDANLAGDLEVALWDGFTPTENDTFDVLTASTILDNGLDLTGASGFTYSILGSAGSGQTLQLTYVPEPTTLGLLGIGGLVCLRRRKR